MGRGVLVDFHSWAIDTGKKVDVNGGYAITLSDVKAVLTAQKTDVKPGDILVFRSGWLRWFTDTSPNKVYNELCKQNEPGKHRFIGLAQEEAFVEWLWENQIAAVAGDQVAFECTPPAANEFGSLHENLLAGLGCPIGELFDTEALAQTCTTHGRHTFFLTSAPMRVCGGVASTCNAIAIF